MVEQRTEFRELVWSDAKLPRRVRFPIFSFETADRDQCSLFSLCAASMAVRGHSRRALPLNLCAHSLKAGCERLELFFLSREALSLLCDGNFNAAIVASFCWILPCCCSTLRCYLRNALSIDVAVLVENHEIGTYCFYVLGYKSELRCSCGINLQRELTTNSECVRGKGHTKRPKSAGAISKCDS